MENITHSLNWQDELKIAKVGSIGNDIILLEKPVISSILNYPFKVDVTTAIISIHGTTEGVIDLKPYKTTSPCLITILPDQILEHKYISEDFSGLFIIMSKRFTDSLLPNARDRLPLFLSVKNNPSIPLNERGLNAMTGYFNMLKEMIKVEKNPYRMKVVKHLTLAFLYGAGFHLQDISENKKKSRQELLSEDFLKLVQLYYKKQRGLEFYADKLCITAKHLSKVIKETTNRSANGWIDEYIILEAKALLKSTSMTIQQISEELNFPSQSFFGKYFKRRIGISPTEYKGK